MADPRKTVDHEGLEPRMTQSLNADNVTILYGTAAQRAAAIGLAVNLSANNTAQLANDGEAILGVVESVEADGVVTVHYGPVVTFKGGTAATLTPGSRIVGDLLVAARGYVQTAPVTTAGTAAARGMIVDASDANAVQVVMP